LINNIWLGVLTGAVLVGVTFTLAYGQRWFPRLGPSIDALTKAPAPIANVLLAIAVLLTFAGPPFSFAGTPVLLMPNSK
jgi:hypothetical protein